MIISSGNISLLNLSIKVENFLGFKKEKSVALRLPEVHQSNYVMNEQLHISDAFTP